MKRLILFIFLTSLLLTSCAKEEVINISEPDKPALKANSALAILMKRTSLNDGSGDNIIDNANCFNIELPVTVIVNGLEITIASEDDFDTIESIFEEFSTDVDSLQIIFPVTIILSDYTQVIINNENEFDAFSDSCNGENEFDDDIECLDFQYPINISIFNIISEQIVDITINNDEDMHDFIEDLDENDIANISFPITILLFDGTEIMINSLDQLEIEIANVEDDCDEDDDYDFDDDDIDNTNTTAQEFSDYLVSCPWLLDELEVNEQEFENFKGTIFIFNANGTVTAELNSVISSGIWNVTSDSGLKLNLTMDSLTEINNNWRLNKIEEEDDGKDKIDLRVGTSELKFIKNCN